MLGGRPIPDWIRKLENENPGKGVCYYCLELREECGYKTRICKECRREKGKSSLEEKMRLRLSMAKIVARRKGWEFSLTLEEVLALVPEKCPVFNVPFDLRSKEYQPSLDRIDSSKGYTKDNIQIISWRANDLKKDGELWEFEALVRHMRNTR